MFILPSVDLVPTVAEEMGMHILAFWVENNVHLHVHHIVC